MNKNQSQSSNKQVITFFSIMILVVVGFLGVIIKTDSNRKNNPKSLSNEKINNPPVEGGDGFLGERGKTLQAKGGRVYIDEAKVSDGNLHAFNYYSDKQGKSLYFFVVKASDGTYRAAANACEVCYESQKGFKQAGDLIRCENCRVTYSKDQIALQKGGCNPRPINKDAKVINGQLAIEVTDIEKTADLF